MRRLSKDERREVAAACEYQLFELGQAVFSQGDIGQDFFVISEGEAHFPGCGNSFVVASKTKLARKPLLLSVLPETALLILINSLSYWIRCP
mmetsp:Transcript_66949/g.105955  ORF Transcript_66949/g.105955 Transcript_66949/m.105955 type:complete len:92 (-) Transcript_66949:134-409(-)